MAFNLRRARESILLSSSEVAGGESEGGEQEVLSETGDIRELAVGSELNRLE